MWWQLILPLLNFIFSSALSQDLADTKWLEEARSYSDISARASRYDWTGVQDNPECPGNVITLNSGEATRIQSHKSFGKESYPDDYRVSQSNQFSLNTNQLMVVYLIV